MKTDPHTMPTRRWTAAELRKLPPKERDAILLTAAEVAEDLYINDASLTDFEAFAEEDLHGESTATEG